MKVAQVAEALQAAHDAGVIRRDVKPSNTLVSGVAAGARPPIGGQVGRLPWGVVLYQLLVGDFAHPLTTDWAKRISDPLLREDLEKCFAGSPEERLASARD